MEDEEAELRNPFPSPPSHYQKYTAHNLHLLSLLRERAGDEDPANVDQASLLADQDDVPDWSLVQLEKPRVDWMVEEGQYTVFGEDWPVSETIRSLGESGGQQLYPADPSVDRRPALQGILRSMLVTYSRLMSSVLVPPPTSSSITQPEWVAQCNGIQVMAENIMAAANDLRPVQARGNLELLMKRQLDVRRDETRAIHAKCDALEAKLAEMRAAVQGVKDERQPAPLTSPMQVDDNAVDTDDVLRWAEEVG